jgi:cellulose synthase catalytic subunit (UDP-forming)
MLFLCFTAVIYLDWQHQLLLAILTSLIALWMNRSSKSYAITLTLTLLSVYSTLRYAFWRVSSTLAWCRDPGGKSTGLNIFFVSLLLLAEGYAILVLLLGYIQTLWPLRRAPVPLPDDPNDWPAVDLLIPTLDEPLSMVRFTALAAMNIDWPANKLNVYILDDGRRAEFRAFAEGAGIGYISRDDNRHAKAGNINHALQRLDAPFVAVFDCDHVPTRSFLQLTMGWFLRDRKLAMLQTPHHFYSPDPFERNLDMFRTVPGEDELFYGVVQDGNDFWNATCFCGSCAVLRRSALNQAGGMAVETVTEDAHTSLRMQMRGWNTAYINIPQAAGLATERLSGHVRQRIRWARGMVQILRIENPILAPGLRPAQRLCYLNAMLHFLYALPRLIFLTAPLLYLIFGSTNIPGIWIAIAAYAVPHLLLSNLTNSRIQGQHRHSFWNEIYETVMAPYILLPTLMAVLSPGRGRFNTTAKGGLVDREFFDARIARPYLLLLAFNLFGLLCAGARLFQFPTFSVPPWLSLVNWPAHLYHGDRVGTICINLLWTLFNLTILGVAIAVARESPQRRRTARVAMAVPSDLILPDGSMIQGVTSDLSGGGVRTLVHQAMRAKVGDPIRFVFPVLDGTATLPATIVAIDGSELRAQFDSLNMQEDEALSMILYSRADSWLGWSAALEPDQPLRSLRRIVNLSTRGIFQTLRGSRRKKDRLATSVVPILLLVLLAGDPSPTAHAAQPDPPATSNSAQWSRIDSSSTIELTGSRLPQANDLSALPAPFVEPASNSRPEVPIVFLTQPSFQAMQAAAVVASWIGIQSGDRPVRFPVSLATIPAGNAIVFAENPAAIPASLGISGVSSPTVAMRANPSDPNSKVLVVIGETPGELLTAAIALALHGDTWKGGQTSIHDLTLPTPRQPDDAPRWLSTGKNRITKFAEIAQTADLQGDGSVPINVTLRLPPDLDLTETTNVGFHLSYRYNGVPLGDGSTLQVYINGAYVSSTPMPHRNSASAVLETLVPIPVVDLRPSTNVMTLKFVFDRAAPCEQTAPANLQGAILKDSYLDIAGITHLAVLPNLELFANAGFPFTRQADLAGAAVVLPDQPSTAELEMFLALMGHFGAQTGYPALRVEVTNAAGMTGTRGKDYLVIGTAADQPALKTLDSSLPLGIDQGGLQLRDTQDIFDRATSWTRRGSEQAPPGQLDTSGALPDALIEGVEWPRGSKRTVVVIIVAAAAAPNFVPAFLKSSQSPDIAQSVSVLHGAQFTSYRMGNSLYRIGDITPLMTLTIFLQEYPWLIALVAVLSCFLMAILLQAMLRRRARERLQTED